MFDFGLFAVCLGLLFVYIAFLIYEWINYRKKKEVKFSKECEYNFVMPAANRIYCILQSRFRLQLKEETAERYRKLYVGKSDDDIIKDYFLKHISLFLYTYLAFHLIVLITILSCQHNQDIISGYYIEKNGIGGVQKQIDVQTDINGLKKDTSIVIPERKYNGEETVAQAEKVKKYIYSTYLGRNKSADCIKADLHLARKVKGSMINISWLSSNENIVATDGKIDGRKITIPEKVELTAVLKYDQYKEKLKFNITVIPVKKTKEESIWEKWRKELEKSVEETKSFKYLRLPDKVNGLSVKYSVNKYDKLWQTVGIMFLMFIIVPFVAESISKNKLSDREKQLKLAYPEMIEKFILLINAGLPVKSAWVRIAETQNNKQVKNDYLVEEMLLTKNQMENGLSEEKAYEMFGRRIGLLPYMKFCTLLVQNLKKGTADLIKILEYESADIFSERKENAKILGEEASTRLLMPMMIMMVIIFAIILYAAFTGM